MNTDSRFLNAKEAALYIGKSYRWMQRHYVDLIKNGVKVYRMPRESTKGHLLFERHDLDRYIRNCQIAGKSLEQTIF